MRRSLLLKIAVTLVLAFLLGVPLAAVRDVIAERQQRNESVLNDVKRSGVGEQRITGPILVIPFRETRVTEIVDETTGGKSTSSSTRADFLHFLPEALDVRVDVKTDTRRRGIYSALVFRGRHTLTGTFVVPEGFGLEASPSVSYAWGDAYLVLGVGDPRGIRGRPSLRFERSEHTWLGGTKTRSDMRGIHADLGRLRAGTRHAFEIGLDLEGTEAIDYVPVGKQTTVAMKANWPHPSFGGQFLPERRTIGPEGFESLWKTSHLASNVDGDVADSLRAAAPAHGLAPALGVAFIDPVDVYLKSERAAKYGFLFIGITFVVFFLLEVLERLAIHPVQYGLVGVALAMFFLLLLALAEHVAFGVAYVAASSVCVGLLGFYTSFALRSVGRGLGFAGALAGLYGALYVLLQSEDMALLMGAVLLFALLAVIMVVTRRVDWYRVSAQSAVSE